MAKKPWKTSNGIIEAVKRQIAIPIAQGTFLPADILLFADEEMQVSQTPSILMYNEEYLVYGKLIPLQQNVTRYPIPDRAIGMKIRDINYSDSSGTLYDMTRISPNDKDAYQQNLTSFGASAMAFYLENNDVVLSPGGQLNNQGFLLITFYMRPNNLVPDEQAAIVRSFKYNTTVVNSSISPGDVFSVAGVSFTAVASTPTNSQFEIGATSVITAGNLAARITSFVPGVTAATDGTGIMTMSTSLLTNFIGPKSSNFAGMTIQNISASNSVGFVISDNVTIVMTEEVRTDFFSNGSLIDILETSGGHKIKAYDVTLVTISGSDVTIPWEQAPYALIVGDYICNQYECIIPFIPTDLHTTLCQRTAERMLASIGDKEGAAEMANKVARNESVQSAMISNRAEGAPQKIVARHSLLRYRRNGRSF